MAIRRKKESGMLLLGDIVVFIISLWLTLTVRNLQVPSMEVFAAFTPPFLLLFVIWIVVFFIAGLYDRQTLLVKTLVPQRVLSAHMFNLAIASIFFYVLPYFGITPKTTLFLYLLVSTVLIGVWRFVMYPRIVKTSATKIIIIAEGKEVDELVGTLSGSKNALIHISKIIHPSTFSNERMENSESTNTEVSSQAVAQTTAQAISAALKETGAHIVAVDLLNPSVQAVFSSLYQFIFSGVQFINVQDLYEDVTDRVPLGLINETWFLEHASIEPNFIYDALKRIMDIVIALPLAIISLVFYPFVWVARRIENLGPVFIYQERIGENQKLVKIVKFGSMTVDDKGAWVTKGDNRVTKVGAFLRKSRIDELPQLWNVIRGDLSLIGPRPELPKLVTLYEKEIPHYNVRHLIKPGLSGWAQIHHEKPPHSIEETFEKLSYDLYYIKHRSLWLDLRIALRTVQTLISRVGV